MGDVQAEQTPKDPGAAGADRAEQTLIALGGTRIKTVRHTPIPINGRCVVQLFEAAAGPEGEDRAHPRLRLRFDHPPEDPDPNGTLATLLDAALPPGPPPADPEAALRALGALWRARFPQLRPSPPEGRGSPAFAVHQGWVRRKARYLRAAERTLQGWAAEGRLSAEAAARCHARLSDQLYFGLLDHAEGVGDTFGHIIFDDNNTGTYHAFMHDEPFVHALEALEASLPRAGGPGWAALAPEDQAAVERQRGQLRAHLDHLMRHKYAKDGVDELDIERSVGAQLIDRQTRAVASERPESAGSLRPEHERLEVAEGPLAGQAVARDGALLRLAETWAELSPPPPLRRTPLSPDQLTFRRAPDPARLRAGLRFDWDGDGLVSPGGVGWVSWAGHCDIKAILEQLGLDLGGTGAPAPTLHEHRVETGATTRLPRAWILELLCASLELGSDYQRIDAGAPVRRGTRRFGGSRHDARPDRLQLQGLVPGQGLRWPADSRPDRMRVVRLQPRGGEPLPLGRAFARHIPSFDPLRIDENPRFLKVVDGDCNLIEVSGHLLEVDVLDDTLDPATGQLRRAARRLRLPLWPAAEDPPPPLDGEALPTRHLLGALLTDPQRRAFARVWLNRLDWRIEIERLRAERGPDGGAQLVPEGGPAEHIPLQPGGSLTLSRELRREDPSQFSALLGRALRGGENICADTDKGPEVWNGVVLRMDCDQPADDLVTRTERWRVRVEARFGTGTLDWLLERGPDGAPLRWCAAMDDENAGGWPDFLWQELPDVGSKGLEDGAWVVNSTMKRRGLVTVRPPEAENSAPHVEDDHIKHIYEQLFCALDGYPYTLLLHNRRYGFRDERSWKAAIDALRPAAALT